ncbi:hypothetical protein CU669_09320 [Paramagnetospirillum kuznetsovii]|uniref:Hemerythrin-like domain-containing protein n=1 Tax=Paramagnetospirillum kuznetsovii TaxID=2053833 RepID=A0A364NZ11_9PROT|nr:hemerythrin domain-containing protein [Paramagnetospirillum kuznetsovii]RAU22311.1 hypothetical protein CU669_09320 [Paramagnetospirillum kuznetsovii]
MSAPRRAPHAIGHPDIDRAHSALADVIGVLSAGYCDADLVDTQIKILERYVIEHFALEESLMFDSGYPDLAEHKALHQYFREKVRRLRAQWAETGHPDLHKSIAEDLSDWLSGHIESADRAYIPWILGTLTAE